MTTDQLINQLLAEVRELKAMVAQIAPVAPAPTMAQEIAAVEAQGINIAEYFKEKGRAAVKRQHKSKNRHG